jgi:hypothetical protein
MHLYPSQYVLVWNFTCIDLLTKLRLFGSLLDKKPAEEHGVIIEEMEEEGGCFVVIYR